MGSLVGAEQIGVLPAFASRSNICATEWLSRRGWCVAGGLDRLPILGQRNYSAVSLHPSHLVTRLLPPVDDQCLPIVVLSKVHSRVLIHTHLPSRSSRRRFTSSVTMGKKPIIGLLGGGQLGRMLCEAAGPLGIEIAVLDEEGAPAKQAANLNGLHVTGSFKDAAKIRELAGRCDILTVEIEHVDTEVLEDIAENGIQVSTGDGSKAAKRVAVHPSWKSIRLIQDKYLQKEHFRKESLPVAEQMAISSDDSVLDSLKDAGRKFGYPFMLKVGVTCGTSSISRTIHLTGSDRPGKAPTTAAGTSRLAMRRISQPPLKSSGAYRCMRRGGASLSRS